MLPERTERRSPPKPSPPPLRKLAASILSPLRDSAVDHAVSAEESCRGTAPRVSARLHWMTIGLSLLAANVFAAAECERSGVRRWLAASAAIQGAAVLVAAAICRRTRDVSVISPLLVLVVIATFIWEPIGRWFFEMGRPLEIIVMTGMRNLMLGLAAAACWRKFGHLAGLLSLFLVLFSATMAASRAIDVLLAVYSAAAVWWMFVTHWDRLRVSLLASQSPDAPRPWIVLVPLLVVVVVGAAGLGAHRAMSVAAGFLPSSGGSGKYDPFAEQGVGDGDLLVAGMENIQSFAPIEDAPFRASDEPSLYDLFNDAYEEPVKTKKQDRAVALPAEFSGAAESRMAQSERANREFSTLRRRGKKGKSQVGDLKSDALFYVAGRTPLHLRMEVYDLFDGTRWLSEPVGEKSVTLRVDRVQGRPWIVPNQFARAFDSILAAESHALKIVNLDTPYIPAPLNLRGVHIDLVETESMFQWSVAGLVRMDRRKLPSLVPIHLASLVVDSRGIDRELLCLSPTEARYGELPVGGQMSEIADLALRWSADRKRGWRQIAAVVSRLRDSYTLDSIAPAPEDSDCPVVDFLLDSHRGPDYQFATAAALMLRSLGYSTRVVSGFYADPKKFDARSRHT
ncbi:MAG TPA: transglutaminase-like domain-containing protein, partial [Planctomycetaceae bacterium]